MQRVPCSARDHHLLISTMQVTKESLRGEFSESWIAFSQTEWQGGWKMLSSPAVEKALAGVLARLSAKKSPKL